MTFIDYYTYIQSPEWKTKKDSFKQMIRNCNDGKLLCQTCSASDRELHIHHKKYCRLGNENKGDLVLLCKDCHFELHNSIKYKNSTTRSITSRFIKNKRAEFGITSRNHRIIIK